MTVVVNELPGPEIICPGTVCAGDTETYSTSAVCSNYNWSVIGGVINGAPPFSDVVSVTWGSTGPGILTLDVNGCDTSFCSTPTSILIPIISPTTSVDGPAIVCANDSYTYSVSNLPGSFFNWTVTGGGTIYGSSNTSQITVYWGNTGGTVSVDYTNPELGCEGNGTLDVVVAPSYQVVGTESVCVGGSTTYSTFPAGVFEWQLKDNTGTIQSFTGSSFPITWPTSGQYQVVAIDNSSVFCNSPQSSFVSVQPEPPAPSFIDGPAEICAGVPYSYISAPDNANYYLEWTVVGGNPISGSGNQITVIWEPAGPYSISVQQLSVQSPNCPSAPFTLPVIKKVIPLMEIDGPDSTCTNSIRSYNTFPTDLDDYIWTIVPSTLGSVITGQGTAGVDIQWNNAIGTAIIELKAKKCGDSAVFMQEVVLTAPPIATIIVSGTGCQGDPISFSTPTSGSSYTWDFGDTNGDGGPTVNHTYATVGNFIVTLTVDDPGGCIGSSVASEYITIVESPVANLTTPDPRLYCPGDPISTTMHINTQPGNSYLWVGGAASGSPATSFTTTLPGNFYVQVTNSNGCVTNSNTISVNYYNDCLDTCVLVPGASIDFSTTGPFCNTVNFFENITNGSLLEWNFGDPLGSGPNTSTSSNPSHTYDQAGYYQVTLTGLMAGIPDSCEVEYVETIAIPAVANFEWNVLGCPTSTDYEFNFLDRTDVVAPFSITNWTWDFGGINSSSSQNPTGILLPPGSHIVTLTITTSAGTTCVVSHVVEVPALPVASFTANNSICDGNFVSFSSTSSGNIVETLWSFGDMATSKLNPTTRVYNAPGSYIATLTVTDAFGCTSSTSQTIEVLPNNLSVDINPDGPTTFCQGDQVNLDAAVTGGNPALSYMWSNLETTSSIIANQTGSYSVTVTDSDGCIRESDPIYVAVDGAPNAVILGATDYCLGDEVNLTANQGPSNTYQWFVNGINYIGDSDLSFYTISSGMDNITLVITGANGCTDTSAVFTIDTHAKPLNPSITSSNDPAVSCSGDLVTLTVTNSQGLTDYMWNTGETTPSITATSSGLYSVDVFNQYGCSATDYFWVQSSPDFSDFMTGCYDYCDTTNVTWVAPSGPYTYQWLLDGIPIVPDGTSNTYTIPGGVSGLYQVVINSNGCIDTSGVADVRFTPCVGCDVDAYIKSIVCGPLDADGNQTYLVDMGINNPFGPSVVYTLSTPSGNLSSIMPTNLLPGYNSVTAIFTDLTGGGAGILCVTGTILINGRLCEFEMCIDKPDCENNCEAQPAFDIYYSQESKCDVRFRDLSWVSDGCEITDWFWDFGDGTTASVQHPFHTYTADGTYNVCLTITLSDGSQYTICQVVVIEGCDSVQCDIKPFFKVKISNEGKCEAYFFGDAPLPDGCEVTSWSWDFGDGQTSGLQNPVHQFPGNGTYNVCLTVTASNGVSSWSAIVCQSVTITDCEPVDCKIEPNFIYKFDGCKFKFKDISISGATIYDWQWDFGDGTTTSGIANPVHTFPGNGIYVVCLKVFAQNGNQSCFAEVCFKVKVTDCKKPCIILSDFDYGFLKPCQIKFTDITSVPVGYSSSWSWDFGDGSTSTAQNPIHTFPGDGTYSVCLVVHATSDGLNECPATYQCVDIVIKGCKPSEDTKLEAWPNPSSGVYNLNVSAQKDDIRVFNSVGQPVTFRLEQTKTGARIELDTKQEGAYVLMILTEGGAQETMLLKR